MANLILQHFCSCCKENTTVIKQTHCSQWHILLETKSNHQFPTKDINCVQMTMGCCKSLYISEHTKCDDMYGGEGQMLELWMVNKWPFKDYLYFIWILPLRCSSTEASNSDYLVHIWISLSYLWQDCSFGENIFKERIVKD